jgi:hypothetical protein
VGIHLFCIFLQFSHQVDKKNIVRDWKYFYCTSPF